MISDEQIESAVALRGRVADCLAEYPDGPNAPEFHVEFCHAVDAITCALLQVEAIHDVAGYIKFTAGLAKTVLPDAR